MYLWTLGTQILNLIIRLYACAVSKGICILIPPLRDQLTCFVSLSVGTRQSDFRYAIEMWSVWKTQSCSSITEKQIRKRAPGEMIDIHILKNISVTVFQAGGCFVTNSCSKRRKGVEVWLTGHQVCIGSVWAGGDVPPCGPCMIDR